MGIFKKSLAVFLAALMLVSVFSVMAFAADGPGAGDLPGGTTVVVRGTLPGMDWDGTYDDANTMSGEGTYSISYDSVAAGNYQFKVVTIDSLGNAEWIGKNGANFDVVVSADSDLTITFNAGTKAVEFSGTNVSEKTDFSADSVQVMGTVPGTSWSFDTATQMTEVGEGVWSVTFNNVSAGSYLYKFAANGSWDANWGAAENCEEDLSGDGVFNSSTNFNLYFEGENQDVTFTLDLTNFNFATKEGATYSVTLSEPTTEEPTELTTEEVTEPATEATPDETEPVSEDVTEPVSEDVTEPVSEDVTEPDSGSSVDEETTGPSDATPEETEPEAEIVPGFYLVGSEEVCGAEWGWDAPWLYGKPMQQATDGTYFQVATNVPASAGNITDEGNDVYVFKVVYVDENGNITWHPGGMGNNTVVTVDEDDSTILFQFKLLASRPTKEGKDPEAVFATVYGPEDELPDFTDPKYPTEEEDTTAAPSEDVTEPATDATPDETQPASNVTEPASDATPDETVPTTPVATKTYKYIPSAEDIASGKNFKITIEDANGEMHTYDLVPTDETVDGQTVYAAEIPESIAASKIHYQVFDGETFVSQVTKDASEVADGSAVKYDGTIAGQDTTEPETGAPTVEPTVAPTDAPTVAPTTTAPTTAKAKVVTKANTVKVKVKKAVKVKAKKLKKKKVNIKISKFLKITGAQGKVTFAKVKKGTAKKIYKKIKINKKTGKVTLKKGKYAKKTYKIKVKIKVAGKTVKNVKYKAKTITKTIKLKVTK